MMPGHTARYCQALADLYVATGDEDAKRRALSGFNALTYMQSPAGLFRTFFQRVKRRADLKLTRDSIIRVTDKPEDILVIVAGGDGSQSQYIHVWGQSTPQGGSTRSVTKLIKD